MTRPLLYALGGGMIALLLAISTFGSLGHLTDPYAARGAIVGVFLMMQLQRYRCRVLLTKQVLAAAFLGAWGAALFGRYVWPKPCGVWTTELIEVTAASILMTAIMGLGFYCLTLRRGRMP